MFKDYKRFGTMPECDGQTDRETDEHYSHISIARQYADAR